MESLFHFYDIRNQHIIEKMFHLILLTREFLDIIFYISLISTMTDAPIIQPINITEYEFKQSKYEHAQKLPFRSIIVASSTGGKTALIQKLILNAYRSSFARKSIFSPSVHNDPTFTEVKNASGMNCTWMMRKNKSILIIRIQVI